VTELYKTFYNTYIYKDRPIDIIYVIFEISDLILDIHGLTKQMLLLTKYILITTQILSFDKSLLLFYISKLYS